MAESIKVVIRFRGKEEVPIPYQLIQLYEHGQDSKWDLDRDEKTIQIPNQYHLNRGADKDQIATIFTFDKVLDPNCHQDRMYKICGFETIHQYMKGYNGTIFAYGQSGSGKTYTMLGPDEVVDVIKQGATLQGSQVPKEIQGLYGIIPRAIYEIFIEINKQIEIHNAQFEIKCHYFEIYQESLNNLLTTNPSSQQNLKLREQKNGQIMVLNCEPIYVTSPQDIFELLMVGQRNRAVASTNQNERSSRSHTIFVIEYLQKNPDGSMKQAKLNLVDLAGSERISKTGATGKVLEEAKKINLSLTQLGLCIKNLVESKSHIPFRDSKLTFFLKESLGGNSKTTLICTTSLQWTHIEESVQTLKFAQRAKKIKNKAITNITKSPQEMEQLINKLKGEIISLKKQLIEGGFSPQMSPYLASELDGVEVPDFQSQNKINPRNSVLLMQGAEDLQMKITEIQNEYEHYKEYSDNRIVELEDQVERLQLKTMSNEELQEQLQKVKLDQDELECENRALKIKFEEDEMEYKQIIEEMEGEIQAKDQMNKFLELSVDQLKTKLENAGFETFQEIKESIFNEEMQEAKDQVEIIKDYEKELEQFNRKQEERELEYNELKEENQSLKDKIKALQLELQQERHLRRVEAQQNEIDMIMNQSQEVFEQSPDLKYIRSNSQIPGIHMRQVTNTKKELLNITIENLKMVQMNQKLISYIKSQQTTKSQLEPQLEEYQNKVIKLESDLQDLRFQKNYLEKAAQEKNEATIKESQEMQQKCKQLEEKVMKLEIEATTLKKKNQKWFDENLTQSKMVSDLKKKVQSLTSENQQAKKQMQIKSAQYSIFERQKAKQMRGFKDVISKKVKINQDMIFSRDILNDYNSYQNLNDSRRTYGGGDSSFLQRQALQMENRQTPRASMPETFDLNYNSRKSSNSDYPDRMANVRQSAAMPKVRKSWRQDNLSKLDALLKEEEEDNEEDTSIKRL